MKLIITLNVETEYVKDSAVRYLGQKIVELGKDKAVQQFPLVETVTIEDIEVTR